MKNSVSQWPHFKRSLARCGCGHLLGGAVEQEFLEANQTSDFHRVCEVRVTSHSAENVLGSGGRKRPPPVPPLRADPAGCVRTAAAVGGDGEAPPSRPLETTSRTRGRPGGSQPSAAETDVTCPPVGGPLPGGRRGAARGRASPAILAPRAAGRSLPPPPGGARASRCGPGSGAPCGPRARPAGRGWSRQASGVLLSGDPYVPPGVHGSHLKKKPPKPPKH